MAEEKAPRPSGKNDDIIKELEDYVNEKKKTGKYLDDISEFHEAETQIKQKERTTSKKNNVRNDKILNKDVKANPNLENNQIDVYDYCDKMMKDLGHFEKKIEGNISK